MLNSQTSSSIVADRPNMEPTNNRICKESQKERNLVINAQYDTSFRNQIKTEIYYGKKINLVS